jgi:hypothetical protein
MRGGGLGLLLSFLSLAFRDVSHEAPTLGPRFVIQFKLTVSIDYEASIEGLRI